MAGREVDESEEDLVGVATCAETERLPLLHDLVICRELSSHDRRGGNDNGFSNKAEHVRRERFLRVCIADLEGPGCVRSAYFAWLSDPMLPRFLEWFWRYAVGRVRFFFDDEDRPRLAPPLRSLAGAPPFVEPLAFDASRSPGGVISYVPMPFRRALRVSIGGGKLPLVFFHLWVHTYPHGTEVESWSGSENLQQLAGAWSSTAGKAKQDRPGGRSLTLAAGEVCELLDRGSPGTIRAIRMRVPEDDRLLRATWLRAFWDGESEASVDVPLSLLFALENRWAEEPSAHVDNAEMSGPVLGVDAHGCAYFQLPMPFARSARVVLENRGDATVVLDRVVIEVDEQAPAGVGVRCGYLRAHFRDQRRLVRGRDVELAQLGGRGKIVGLVLAVREASVTFLEGDERIWTDGCRSPHIMGDATETYFNGGWYFYEKAFACPLHGAPTFRKASRRPGDIGAVTMYRFHVTDWVPYRSAARFTIQHGPFNNIDGHYRSVVWYYGVARASLKGMQILTTADPVQRAAQEYGGALPARIRARAGFFEG